MFLIASMTNASVDVVLEKPIPGNVLGDVEMEIGLEKLGNVLDVSSC